jgi:hypothetical protein
LTSGVWPIVARAWTAPIWINRANEWASGRNSSVRAPSLNSERRPGIALAMSEYMLRWVSTQPFGRPVVPLV